MCGVAQEKASSERTRSVPGRARPRKASHAMLLLEVLSEENHSSTLSILSRMKPRARSLNPRNTGRKVGYVRVRVDELARREDPCRKMNSVLPLFVHEGFPQYDSGMRVDVRFEAGRQHFVAHRHANFFACSGETLRVASRYAGGDCGRSRQPQRQASCHQWRVL
jgi:hypothetical protein